MGPDVLAERLRAFCGSPSCFVVLSRALGSIGELSHRTFSRGPCGGGHDRLRRGWSRLTELGAGITILHWHGHCLAVAIVNPGIAANVLASINWTRPAQVEP